MKYRTVKASNRLPDEDKQVFVVEKNKYILYASGVLQDGIWYDSRSGNEIEVLTWLEPIPEIKEGEIEDMAINHASSIHGKCTTVNEEEFNDSMNSFSIGVAAIIKLMEGEK